MTQTLNGVLQKLSTQTGGEESLMMLMNLVQFDVCKLTVTYADIDAVSSIEIPQEAFDAPVQDTQDPSAI